MDLKELKHGELRAKINPENGQLVSLVSKNVEFLHDGGTEGYNGPGWKNSEIVPFPIFGSAADSKVKINELEFYLEQHGISRHTKNNPFVPKARNRKKTITLVQEYDGHDVANPKYSEGNGHPKYLNWIPYRLEKKFTLNDKELVCELALTNISDIEMPYMIGWHPAFKLQGKIESGIFLTCTGQISLKEVVEASERPERSAYFAQKTNSVTYIDNVSRRGINVSSKDFGDCVMLWTPGKDAGMFCIEHTSRLPDRRDEHFRDKTKFELLAPGEKKSYAIRVRPLNYIADNLASTRFL
jgi:galactose mutarotase-like enzyme